MYCPQCGQSQPANDVRFCTRCGIELLEINNWLIRVQQLSSYPPSGNVRRKKCKNRGTRRGAKLMFLSAVILPLAFGMGILFDTPGPLIFPLTIFLAGLALLLYTKLFGEELPEFEQGGSIPAPRVNPQLEQARFHRGFGFESAASQTVNPQLEAARFQPARADWTSARSSTAEIVQPPSITEHTTVFFDKE